jgi:uncharacterized protein (DUF1800 family)
MRKASFHGVSSLVLATSLVWPAFAAPPPSPRADDDARIVRALNRLGYGPRPGDVERVRALGLDRWIETQLHPDRVADTQLPGHLAALRTLGLSTHEQLVRYDIPPEARKEAKELKARMGDASEEDMKRARRDFVKKHAPLMEGPPRHVVDELQQAKLLRAVYSERQLEEVLVDFWMNHFNVFAQKGPVKFMLGEYERETIRPHALGRFEDLLRATAESPAMLFYLDNWLSADPSAGERSPPYGRSSGRPRGFGHPSAMLPPEERRPRRKRGLNENYAREIMELHTLGVDGGFTQRDVTEVARSFTGWTIRGLKEQRPAFVFDDDVHDHGPKVILGQIVKGGGQDEGRRVVHMLATHPSTARFISLKLARRFVADDPPAALVDRAAETFRKTDGDIRAVVKTLVTSPEFYSSGSATKVKTPLEFVVSAIRASGARVDDATSLAKRVAAMGMPLYLQQPPTGYKDTADAWVSTSGLVARLNFALDLSAGKLQGVRFDPASLAAGPGSSRELAAVLSARLVPAGLSEATRKTLDGESGSQPDAARVAGLILGSPEFQSK